LFLPQDEDPDTYVRKLGKDAFEKLLKDAKPLSQFLLDELKSHVNVEINEGRASFLQEAKPLVKRIAAPMLSLMLRKQLAEVAKVSEGELNTLYDIRTARKSAPPTRSVNRTTTSLIRKLMLRMMIHPGLLEFVDDAVLCEAHVVNALSEFEISAFQEQVKALRSGQQITSWFEYFRDSAFSDLFKELEKDLIELQALDLEQLKPEFQDFWRALIRDINRAHASAIVEKSNIQPLSGEAAMNFRKHQRAIGNVPGDDKV
jgi:DNA primase